MFIQRFFSHWIGTVCKRKRKNRFKIGLFLLKWPIKCSSWKDTSIILQLQERSQLLWRKICFEFRIPSIKSLKWQDFCPHRPWKGLARESRKIGLDGTSSVTHMSQFSTLSQAHIAFKQQQHRSEQRMWKLQLISWIIMRLSSCIKSRCFW